MDTRKILLFSMLAISIASADAGMMGFDGYGMMDGGLGLFGMGLLWLIYLAIASLIFSVIFWLTYNMLAKKK